MRLVSKCLSGVFAAVLLSAVVLLGAIGCGPGLPDYDYAREPNPRQSEFVIGVADELQINVWKNEALSTSVIVRPDGTITLPLVGDMQAANKTPTQLKMELRKKLMEYIKLEGSEVTIAVTDINSIRFTVGGEVTKPNVYDAKQYPTVAEAIALAGGFTKFAKRDEIVLIRKDAKGNARRIPIAYTFIENGSHPEMNLVLTTGDSLYVP